MLIQLLFDVNSQGRDLSSNLQSHYLVASARTGAQAPPAECKRLWRQEHRDGQRRPAGVQVRQQALPQSSASLIVGSFLYPSTMQGPINTRIQPPRLRPHGTAQPNALASLVHYLPAGTQARNPTIM
jgi:hypothetical protein